MCSQNVKVDVECCTICKVCLISEEIYNCSLYNPPQNIQYRYDVDNCYHPILEAIPKKWKAVICCDLNFPSTNWGAYWSTDKEEQDVLNILEERLLRQAIDFPTCGKNFLDVLLYQNSEAFSQIDINFKALYECSDRLPDVLSVEFDYQQEQRTKERYYSFTNKAVFDSMLWHQNFSNLYASQMQITCTTNSRTTPRHSSTTMFQKEHGFDKALPPWIAAATSNQMKMLNTQRIKLTTRPTT